MEGFHATPEEMGRASALASTTYDEVRAELGVLRSRVGDVAAGWSGDAFGRFTAVMRQWDDSARSLTEALDGIATALRTSGAAYQAQDDETARGLSSLITDTLG
ncbi:WXG100 family type VII secretion target [Pseudonocardia sp.]|uniref:WXG100 family type VII secretion target n=1 Tax=Pseudonocardia sp. TaxID=60912 RepID=UPI00261C76D2|nr:WXG100 family type VII secretion target [Pseudonocardia sp.]